MFKRRRSYKVGNFKINTGKRGVTSFSTKLGPYTVNSGRLDKRSKSTTRRRAQTAQSEAKKKGCGCLPFFTLALLLISMGVATA